MKKAIFSGLAAVTLSGCMTAADYRPIRAPDAVDMATKAARYSLRNPDVAQFRNVRAYAAGSDGWLSVCGSINGQNAYGGFTGFQPFRATIKPNGGVHAVYINDLPAVSAPC